MSYINVHEIAEAREFRQKKQIELLIKYKLPLISFTLNIPGPEKNSPLFRKIHHEGISAISASFTTEITHLFSRDENTGCEAYFTIDLSTVEIKKRAIEIEENHKLGRIFDIDVISENFQSVSRRELNKSPRKCLICSEDSALCSRSRKHSVEELLDEIRSICREL